MANTLKPINNDDEERQSTLKPIRSNQDRGTKTLRPINQQTNRHTPQQILDIVNQRQREEIDIQAPDLGGEQPRTRSDLTAAESTPTTTEETTLGNVRQGLRMAEGTAGILTHPRQSLSALQETLRKQGLPRTAASFAEGGGRLIEAGGEATESLTETLAQPFAGGAEADFSSEITDNLQDSLESFAERQRAKATRASRNEALERYLEGKPSREEQNIIERFSDPEYVWGDIVGNAAASYAPVIASGILGTAAAGPVGGFAAASATGGVLEGGAAIGEAKEFLENSDNEAYQRLAEDDEFLNDIGLLTGTGAAALEGTPIGRLLRRSPVGKELFDESILRFARGLASQAGRAATEEGVTESFQEILANSVASVYNENQDLFEGVPEGFLGGFLTGGPASIALDTGPLTEGLPAGLSIEDISDGDNLNQDTNEIIRQAYEQTLEDGGITIDPVTGDQPSQGFAVSPYRDRERQVSQNQFSRQDVEQFLEDNRELLEQEHNFLGNWAEDGTIFMDVSTVLNNEQDAVALADMAQQLSIFDLSSFQEVNTLEGVQRYGQETIISRQQELGRELGGLQEAGDQPDGGGGLIQRINRRIDQLESEGLSNTESRESLQELKRQAKALNKSVDEHPAKPLAKYANQDFQLPTTESSKFVQNAEEIVSDLGFDSVEQARESFQQYQELRQMNNTIDEATKSPRFSANQVLNRIRNSENRGVSRGRKLQRKEMVDEWGAQAELTDDLIDSLRDYSREHLSQEGNLKSAISMVNNVAEMRTPPGKKREWLRSMARIDHLADKEAKSRLRNQIKTVTRRIVNSPTVDVEYRNRVKEILSQVDLTGRTEQTVSNLSGLREYVEEQQRQGNDVDDFSAGTLSMLERAYKTPFEQVTVTDLENILEKVGRLEQLGRTKVQAREQIMENRKRRFIEELSANTEAMTQRELSQDRSVLNGEGLTLTDRFGNYVKTTVNKMNEIDKAISPMDVIIDRLDGSPGTYDGSNYNIFKRTLDADWREHLSLRADIANNLSNKVDELGLDPQDTQTWERIGFVAAREQEGGVEKLQNLDYTQEEIQQVELNDSEREMLDYMREKMNEQFPFVQDLMRNLFNEEVQQVDNYFSFMTDWDKMDRTSGETALEDTTMPQTSAFRTKKPEMGFTKARSQPGDQKIKLNALEIFQKHMDNVSYLRSMGEDLKVLFEVANSPEYQEAAGDMGQAMVVDWLDVVARKGQAGETTALLDTLRKNVGAGILGLKLSTIFIQPSAVFDGAGMIGGQYAAKGMYRIIRDPNWREFASNFPELKERVGGETAIEELSQDNWLQSLQRLGYVPMQKVDQFAALSIAAGAYQRKIDELGETVDFNNINTEALEYAQLAVRRTQASAQFKDIPLALSRGTGIFNNKSLNRTLLQFQTFLLNQWSRIRYDAIEVGIKNKDPKQAARILSWTAAATLAATGLRLAQRHIMDMILGAEEEDDEEENEALQAMMYEISGKIPFIGTFASMYLFDGSPAPVLDMFRQAPGGLRSAIQGKNLDTRLRGWTRFLTSVGALGGIPGSLEAQGIGERVFSEERFREEDGVAPPAPPAPAPAPPAPAPAAPATP